MLSITAIIVPAAVPVLLLLLFILWRLNCLPSQYIIRTTRDKWEEPGMIVADVCVEEQTLREIETKFKEYLDRMLPVDPTTYDLTDFTCSYVGEKLRFRHSVLFPQVFLNIFRRLPWGLRFLPAQQHRYFESSGSIDVAGATGRMTDCRDYSELFKCVFNHLSERYEIGSVCYRIRGATCWNLGVRSDDHDFNLIIDQRGTRMYVDSIGRNSWWITNPLDMTHKVRIGPPKS